MHQDKLKTVFLYKNVRFLNLYNLFKPHYTKGISQALYVFFVNTLAVFNSLSVELRFNFLSCCRGSRYFFNNKKIFNSLKLNLHFFLNFVVYYIFLILKKNVFTLFRLNSGLSLNFLYLSFKHPLRCSKSLIFTKVKGPLSWINNLDIFLKKNKLVLVKCLYQLKKNVSSQKQLFLNNFSSNFFYSFFFLWNFLLFTPSLNFLFLNSSLSNFFNYSTKLWESFFKNKICVYKYLNISNADTLRFNYTKLLKFRKLKYKVLKFIEDSLFSDILVRLTESVTGGKSIVSVNKSLKEQLTVYELAKLNMLKRRLQNSVQSKFWRLNTKFLHSKTNSLRHFYRRGFSFFWYEITLICFLMFKSRDTSLLITYVKKKMRFMNLFSHKFFLKKMWLVLRLLFVETRSLYLIYGIKIKISGKLSVTGNSRTRTKIFKEGVISYSNMTIRADYSFSIIKTKTGCLGFSLWLFF